MTELAVVELMASYRATRPALLRWAAKHYVADLGLTPSPMIDLACGDGFWTDVFAELRFRPIGVDVDPANVARGLELYPDLDLYVGDVDEPAVWEALTLAEPAELVFARGLPHFYRYETLAPLSRLLELVLGYVAPAGGKIVLSAYSHGDGRLRDGYFWHHRDLEFELAIAAAQPFDFRVVRVGNYLQAVIDK